MWDVQENCYGHRKRLRFVEQLVAERRPRRILDVGCGTGARLTCPLAARFPEIAVIGIDPDPASIAWANSQPHPANLTFSHPAALPPESRFDLVIASEVLEHIEEPQAFLASLRSYLLPDGTLMLSLPNGYGPFEILSFVAMLLHGPALKRLLAKLRQRASALACSGQEPAKVTLAVSPHVNFFQFSQLRSLLAAVGLAIERYQPTTFLAGPGVDTVLRACNAIDWNARICKRLPPWCASDWMFVLRPAEPVETCPWRRGALSRFRRSLNLRRWGVADMAGTAERPGLAASAPVPSGATSKRGV